MRTTSLPVARPTPQTETQPGHPTNSKQEINADDFTARIKALADDYFQGRGPGTPRGEEAAQWIADELKRIGIAPGITKADGTKSYFQEVPVVNITLDPKKSSFRFNTANGPVEQTYAKDIVFWSTRYDDKPAKEVNLDNSQLVFAGYGINAPEQGKNDYAGLNVKGKTVVVLDSEPGQTDDTPDASYFEGKALTYYGRWPYKIEEAKRQGAAGVIIVHEPVFAPWDRVVNSRGGTHGLVQSKDRNESHPLIQGFMSVESAKELFKRSGLDFDKEKSAAKAKDYKAKELTGQTLSAVASSTTSQVKTRNVVGMTRGTKRPDEYVITMAHWDHLGMDPNKKGDDKINNGAIDNASGVSATLEMAEADMKNGKPIKHDRSKLYLFTTLEEQGLNGADNFAQNLPVSGLGTPILAKNIVAVMNYDELIPSKTPKGAIIVNKGASELDGYFAKALSKQDYYDRGVKKHGRILEDEPDDYKAQGYRYRQDGHAFSKIGVPNFMFFGGSEIDGDKKAGAQIIKGFDGNFYHQEDDEYYANWDNSGAIANIKALYDVSNMLADSNVFPKWTPGNEFKKIRDKDRPDNAVGITNK